MPENKIVSATFTVTPSPGTLTFITGVPDAEPIVIPTTSKKYILSILKWLVAVNLKDLPELIQGLIDHLSD